VFRPVEQLIELTFGGDPVPIFMTLDKITDAD